MIKRLVKDNNNTKKSIEMVYHKPLINGLFVESS